MSVGREVPDPYVQPVAKGAYAYVQPDGGWFLDSTGVLVGSDGSVVLVDEVATVPRAELLGRHVRELAPNGRIRTLVHTHHHGDHTWGACALDDTVTVISTAKARENLIATGVDPQAVLGSRMTQPDWGDLELRLPDVTITEPCDLWVGDDRYELIPMRRVSHTSGDLVVWKADLRVLFVGDLVFNEVTPLAAQGSITGWLETIDELRGFGAEVVVPGHGPVGGPEVFDRMHRYLTWVQDLAADGFGSGTEPMEVAQAAELGEFAAWPDHERLVANIHRAYSELRGEPRGTYLDTAVMLDEMVELKGGPLTCLC